VSKTTTVAKLAASLKSGPGLRVGPLAIETFRLAVSNRLKTYAEVIDRPLAVAETPFDMHRALDTLGMVVLVLVDAVGSSPGDEGKLRESAAFLLPARPEEIHFILSAVSRRGSLRAALERFAVIQVDRLILTKLGEADTRGSILAPLGSYQGVASYLSSGQFVTADFEPSPPSQKGWRVRSWSRKSRLKSVGCTQMT
jgi:flagellar biosynthesis protein FlhF